MFPERLPQPRPADAERAARARGRIAAALARNRHRPWADAAAAFLDDPARAELLDALLAGSPFLAACLEQDPEIAALLAAAPPPEVIDAAIAGVGELPLDSRPKLMAGLRRLRRRVAFAAAFGDLAGLLDLEAFCAALSRFADACAGRAVAHLLLEGHSRGEVVLPDPEDPGRGSGLAVFAMGKLGAFELNYSSDIDLIVFHDTARMDYRGGESPRAFTVRLVRNLVHILEHRTADGYVFRVDLRLRPHVPGNPLAISTGEAEEYYERHGQNWERAAWIKARPHAGDIEAGEAFLRRLRPFVWRRYLDWAAVRDIQSIKRQIHAHRGFSAIRVPGHDIKVGRGGIREIEFFVQTQQLILGGRYPELRTPRTREALARLAEGRWIADEAREELDRAYLFLRSLEHRLQMVEDRQTQRLPERAEDFARFAAFAGTDPATLHAWVAEALETVEHHWAALFEHEVSLGAGGSLVFTGTEDHPETLETLRRMGFRDPGAVVKRIREWHHGDIRATRSARARELLTELTPAILEALSRQPDPDEAFRLFDGFVSALPAGVQIFSLLHANDRLLRLLADLVGAAPRLARTLAAESALFEAMLAPDFFEPLPGRGELRAEAERALGEAAAPDEVLEALARFAHARGFQAGMHLLLGIAPVRAVQHALTALAEVVLEVLLPRVRLWLHHRHGDLPGGRFVVVGLGKLGARELTIGSDLDLVFVYDAPPEARSTGPQPLPPGPFFARLGQRLVSALTVRTPAGRLFEVDMRLRPSGNVGPLATSLAQFEAYEKETAQTWEHQALVRARPVAGDAELAREVERVRAEVLGRTRDPVELAREVAAMNARIHREHGSGDPWNLKYARGGLVDLEFTAQYLVLAHAHEVPALLATETREIFEAAGAAGLLAEGEVADLLRALDLHHALQAVLRLSAHPGFDPRRAPPGMREMLLRTASRALVDEPPLSGLAALEERLRALQETARGVFERLCPPGDGGPDGEGGS
ncbi:Bifunctional glutamine synthetase adenylyltransferase/adenylyl-removing enzyme [bacterium HR39]|nr:Bifunctional glutamine synthetase adenylyltransferase/adenylyl-removing enzyme [bacterium HR39]